MAEHQHRFTPVRIKPIVYQWRLIQWIVNIDRQGFIVGGGLGGLFGSVVIGSKNGGQRHVRQNAAEFFSTRQSVGAEVWVGAAARGFGVAQYDKGRGGIMNKIGQCQRIGHLNENRVVMRHENGVGFDDGFGDDFRVFLTGGECEGKDE